MRRHLPLLILLALLAARGAYRPQARPSSRIPCRALEAWMLEALPGVGPVTAPRLLPAARAGDFQDLPAEARAILVQVCLKPDRR